MASNAYRISFTNQVNDKIEILLMPKDWTNVTIDFKGVAGTFVLSSLNNDDDLLATGIQAKQLQFGYLYERYLQNEIDQLYADPNSYSYDYWKVTATLNDDTKPFFKGYLNLENANRPLLDKNTPIILTATDGLPQLKGLDFKDADGTDFSGKQTPLFFIVQALGKLELGLPLRTCWNTTHVLMTPFEDGGNPFDQVNIKAELFGEKSNVLNAYDAINLLAQSFRFRIFQESGYWWIDGLADRYYNDTFNYFEYTIGGPTSGLYTYTQDSTGSITLTQEIGFDKATKLANADAIRYLKIPNKSIKLTFNYELDTLCNDDFSDLSTSIPLTPISGYTGAYVLQCWTHETPPYASPGVPDEDAYATTEVDDFGDNIGQVAVIPDQDGSPGSAWIRSSLLEAGEYDILTFGVSMAFAGGGTNSGSRTVNAVRIILIADSGNYYNLDNDTEWVQTNSSLSVNARILSYTYNDGDDLGAFVSINITSKPLPESGRLQFILQNIAPATETIYKDLQIGLRLQLADRASEVTGDFNQTQYDFETPVKVEQEVKISDCPPFKRQVKGGLFKLAPNDREEYYPQWAYNGQFVTKQRFTEFNAKLMQSMTRKTYNKIEGSLRKYHAELDGEDYLFGMMPRYVFSDFDQDKEFMLTGSYSIDLTTGVWRGVFVENRFRSIVIDPEPVPVYTFEYIKRQN